MKIHHLAKPSAERRGDIWDRFRGASSIRSGTDANLILDGSGDRVRMYGEFRDAEPLSAYLELDRTSLTFHVVDAPKGTGKVRYINGQRIETKPRPQLPERFAAVPKAITLDAELSRDAKAVATVIASLLNTGNNPTLKVTATDAKVAALIGKGVSQIKARHGRIELEAATLLEVQPAGKAGHNMRFPVALYPSELQAELAKARSIPS